MSEDYEYTQLNPDRASQRRPTGGDAVTVESALFDAKQQVFTNNNYPVTLSVVNSKGGKKRGLRMHAKVTAYYEGTTTKVRDFVTPDLIDIAGKEELKFNLRFKETSARHENKKFYLSFTIDEDSSYRAFETEPFSVLCLFKIVLVGENHVGKSALLQTYLQRADYGGSEIMNNWRATIMHNNEPIVLDLWDTAGSYEHKSILPDMVYTGASIFLVCFALNDRASYERVPEWIAHIKANSTYQAPINFGLIGLKRDARPAEASSVQSSYVLEDEGSALSVRENALFYLECSAREKSSVTQVFEQTVQVLYSSRQKRDSCRDCVSQCVIS